MQTQVELEESDDHHLISQLGERQNKDILLDRILNHAPAEQIKFLCEAGQQKIEGKVAMGSERRRGSKRKHAEEDVEEEYDPSKFLVLPTDEELKDCYTRFWKATSNAAVETSICGVCARECGVIDNRLSQISLSDLPNVNQLIPKKTHPAHDLFDGKLLEPAGVKSEGNTCVISICHSCSEELKKVTDKLPRYSLANKLWIGCVPWQLQVLTFPEQLLIALLYPRVYVFKLFPKRQGGVWDTSMLQRAMRRNVSTYDLNMEGITSMVEGRLMPRPPALLASLISVTFIALGELPKNWIHSTFRVCCRVVFEALQWLKEHNAKYYGNIEISVSRIESLPEDDVPQEITSIIRQSDDVGIVDQESEGYVPVDDNEGIPTGPGTGSSPVHNDPTTASEDVEPDVVPLQVSGTIDTDMSTMTASELMAWGLSNLWKEGREGGYAVRHGRHPVNDFGQPHQNEQSEAGEAEQNQPNFFEKAYPCLFPYGEGGIEGQREVPVDFGDHVRWALRHHDHRFRKHKTFPFVTFGIQQRRQVLASARLQMQRKTFEKDAHLLSTITVEKLQRAQEQEANGLPISDPAVRLLHQHIYATGGRVTGSDQGRLWITINPCDLHDPIAQVFAGENIDLDEFNAKFGPSKEKQAQNVALNPYAAAKFFHFLIKTILKIIFSIEVGPQRIKSRPGIFGHVSAYFGLVESQGRGSLHLHLLLWLHNALAMEEIERLLKEDEFCQCVKAFINANIRAYLPGFNSAESIKEIPNEVEVAYSHLPKPHDADYKEKLMDLERCVACSKNLHTCEYRRCLVPTKNGGFACKRRAPFKKSKEDFIHEDGQWGMKHVYEFMNAWVPGLTVNARCNNDGKLLTNS
ncbi:hypothetical protein PAXINDRAFT_13640 [Paxillus involutus ATCC 200175]|uniref:Helitron helicase-like domain-containing protein n=1 Tax=Paxillus involutus ATCC 200175 TaxID=664439 RepID=A0A0C9SVR9_PAXIN|nr:hypothetical protein PAXINDRAFT_13640 [Paxillus involutus ATCC 200175]